MACGVSSSTFLRTAVVVPTGCEAFVGERFLAQLRLVVKPRMSGRFDSAVCKMLVEMTRLDPPPSGGGADETSREQQSGELQEARAHVFVENPHNGISFDAKAASDLTSQQSFRDLSLVPVHPRNGVRFKLPSSPGAIARLHVQPEKEMVHDPAQKKRRSRDPGDSESRGSTIFHMPSKAPDTYKVLGYNTNAHEFLRLTRDVQRLGSSGGLAVGATAKRDSPPSSGDGCAVFCYKPSGIKRRGAQQVSPASGRQLLMPVGSDGEKLDEEASEDWLESSDSSWRRVECWEELDVFQCDSTADVTERRLAAAGAFRETAVYTVGADEEALCIPIGVRARQAGKYVLKVSLEFRSQDEELGVQSASCEVNVIRPVAMNMSATPYRGMSSTCGNDLIILSLTNRAREALQIFDVRVTDSLGSPLVVPAAAAPPVTHPGATASQIPTPQPLLANGAFVAFPGASRMRLPVVGIEGVIRPQEKWGGAVDCTLLESLPTPHAPLKSVEVLHSRLPPRLPYPSDVFSVDFRSTSKHEIPPSEIAVLNYKSPIEILTDHSSKPFVGAPFAVTAQIKNNTDQPQDLVFKLAFPPVTSMGLSGTGTPQARLRDKVSDFWSTDPYLHLQQVHFDSAAVPFLFSGPLIAEVFLKPRGTRSLSWTFVAKRAGVASLPTVYLRSKTAVVTEGNPTAQWSFASQHVVVSVFPSCTSPQ